MRKNFDANYVNRMSQRNDSFWRTYEKWFYYDYDNQNYIIPTILLNILMIFTNPPGKNILACIFITCLMLYLCHLNNVKMDDNEYFIKNRKIAKEHRMKHNMM